MKIVIDDDFDLYKIAYSGQCFRVRQTDDNAFRFVTKNHCVTICGKDTDYDVSCTADEWNLIWRHYFDLDTDYRKIRDSIPDNDCYLKNAVEIGRGIRILRQDSFEMLISFIISQRKSIPAIKSSVEALCQKYGEPIDDEGLYTFPTPESLAKTSESELAQCSLGYRVPYVMQAAQRVSSGVARLDKLSALSDDELIDELKSFYGVGNKVANCVALFSYHRTSLAPVDTWIQKVIDTEYGGINPFESYGQYAGVMQQYMFYAAQHEKII